MAFVGTGGALEGLYGALGNPTSIDRQRLYGAQTGALGAQIQGHEAEARRAAASGATSAMGGGNPFLAGRVGAQGGADAVQRIASQGVQQQAQLSAQQAAQELQARQHQGQWAQQMLGGLIGAGGQVLGMAVPAFGALGGGGAASRLGGAIGGAPGGLGGILGGQTAMPPGSTLLSPQSGQGIPQAAPMASAQTPQVGIGSGGFSAQGMTAPPGMRWDPTTNQWVSV